MLSTKARARPACTCVQQPAVVMSYQKPRELIPAILLQFPVGVEKRLSDSSCRTAGSCGDTPSISCTWNSDGTLPSLFMLSYGSRKECEIAGLATSMVCDVMRESTEKLEFE